MNIVDISPPDLSRDEITTWCEWHRLTHFHKTVLGTVRRAAQRLRAPPGA
jgi:hypothetical protein